MRLPVVIAAALGAAAALAPGTALAAAEVVADPPSYAFADPATTIPAPAEVRFRNLGDSEAALGLATLTGPNSSSFIVTSDGCSGTTLGVGAECVVVVVFRARTAGSYHASLELPSDAPGSPAVAGLSGTVTVRPRGIVLLRATPSRLEFGKLPFGSTSASREIVIGNVGATASGVLRSTVMGSPLTGSSFALHDDTCAGAILAPGSTCRLSLSFRPQVFGVVRALVVVSDGTTGSRTTVSGNGTERAVPPTPAKGLLARRLEIGARRWAKLPRRALARRGFSLRGVLQPLAGRARLELHAVARRGRAIPVARGGKTLVAGRPTKLTANTTRRGKRLLRSADALKLRATLTFVYDGGKRVIVKRGFRLVP